MTLRNQLLAGLVAALAVPVVALASSSGPTWYDIQNNPALRQRYGQLSRDATSGTTPEASRDFHRKHYQAMTQGADHHAANAIAAPDVSGAPSAEATREWSLRHWRAMQQGCDHQKASFEASKATKG